MSDALVSTYIDWDKIPSEERDRIDSVWPFVPDWVKGTAYAKGTPPTAESSGAYYQSAFDYIQKTRAIYATSIGQTMSFETVNAAVAKWSAKWSEIPRDDLVSRFIVADYMVYIARRVHESYKSIPFTPATIARVFGDAANQGAKAAGIEWNTVALYAGVGLAGIGVLLTLAIILKR